MGFSCLGNQLCLHLSHRVLIGNLNFAIQFLPMFPLKTIGRLTNRTFPGRPTSKVWKMLPNRARHINCESYLTVRNVQSIA